MAATKKTMKSRSVGLCCIGPEAVLFSASLCTNKSSHEISENEGSLHTESVEVHMLLALLVQSS